MSANQYVVKCKCGEEEKQVWELPATQEVAEFVQRILREQRGTREDYQCRRCGHMMSQHDISTLGSVFCPGELVHPPEEIKA